MLADGHRYRVMSQQIRDTFLRTIADAVPCLMAYWDRDLLCSFANKAYSEWFGRPLESIIGESMQSLLGDHVFTLNLPHIDAALAGQEEKFERVFTKADGTITHAWVNYIPHRAPDGTTVASIVLVTDITDLRRADQRSAESESRYRLLADQSSDMVFQLDRIRCVATSRPRLARSWATSPTSSSA